VKFQLLFVLSNFVVSRYERSWSCSLPLSLSFTRGNNSGPKTPPKIIQQAIRRVCVKSCSIDVSYSLSLLSEKQEKKHLWVSVTTFVCRVNCHGQRSLRLLRSDLLQEKRYVYWFSSCEVTDMKNVN
jgi:hypothetical protein